ncbi:MAG TPA: tetratricopeptide repeat protein [Armatimonadota bacterium]|nr:tetratricopeptide repeat protein [Armatimonadota bacterium]
MRNCTDVIVKAVQSALAPLGFTGRGRVFSRRLDDITLLVGLQKDTASDGAGQVTVNLGVHSRALAERLDWNPPVNSVGDAPWNARIGELMPQKRDIWWKFASRQDAARVSNEIVESLLRYGLPAMDAVSSLEQLISFWQAGGCQGIPDALRLRYLAALKGQPAEPAGVPMIPLPPPGGCPELEPHLAAGIRLMELLEYDRAIPELREALRAAPMSAEAHLWLARALFPQYRREARRLLEAAREIAPGSLEVRLELGRVLSEAGRLDAAIVEYQAALSLDPGNERAENGLELCYLALGDEMAAARVRSGVAH